MKKVQLKNRKRGFALLEVILYIGLLGFVLSAAVLFTVEFIGLKAKTVSLAEASRNTKFAVSRIAHEVRAADGIDYTNSVFNVNPGTLQLDTSNPATDPIVFSVSSGQLMMSQAGGPDVALTPSMVEVRDFTLSNVADSVHSRSVSIQLALGTASTGGLEEFAGETSYATTTRVWKGDGFGSGVSMPSTDTFRVTEYAVTAAQFSGTAYSLTLDQDLSSDYFAIVQGSDGNGSTSGDRGPDENYVSLIGDSFGTGDLSTSSGADTLDLYRDNSVNGWQGVVTVVECLDDCAVSGFELLDVRRLVHSGSSASGNVTAASSWSDLDQVMLVGGFNGAGCDTIETDAGSHHACHARIWPSGSSTVNWTREGPGGLVSANSTAMVVEWGSEWTVQRTRITGTNGGGGADAVGEYNTSAISSVARANTWVWGTGHTDESGSGDGAEGTLITLGNGVDQNTDETLLAIGQEHNWPDKDFEVYALTHDDLAVDYQFKTDGNGADLTYDQVVDSAAGGSRMALVTNGSAGSGNNYPRSIFSARYTGDTNIRLERRRSNDDWPAWIQGIDFSGISEGSAPPPDPTFDQSAYRLFANADSTDVGAALAVLNTAATLVTNGDDFRLRALLHVSDAEVAAGAESFKLQFATKSGTCDTGFSGETYADVTAGTAIAYNDNSPADGAALTGNANDPTNGGHTVVDQTYEELNNFTSTAVIADGADGLWDFALTDNDGVDAADYCLRIVKSDGTELDTYSQVFELSTAQASSEYEQSAYRLFANADSTDVGVPLAVQDTAAALATDGDAFRLRLGVDVNVSDLAVSGESFKLQFATKSGTCDTGFSGETYADVTAGTAIAYNDNSPADGAALTSNAADPTRGGKTVANQTYEEASNFSNSALISAGDFGLWDFALIDNDGTSSAEYCFRVVKSDNTPVDTYSAIPEVVTVAYVSLPTFRLVEYYRSFTGSTYNLTLDQDLESEYFVIIRGADGSDTNNNHIGPDESYVALTADPFGTGDLAASGSSDVISLTRHNNAYGWRGVITVVECLGDCTASGFNLLDVQRVSHSGSTTSGSDISGTSWFDIDQVMLMGGFKGSGCDTAQTSNNNQIACYARIWPSGSNTVNWSRSSGGGTLSAATSTVMVVEWGSEWNVQRVNVTGNNGGNGANGTGEYDTGAISSVTRANTFVWGTGHTSDNGIGDAAEGVLLTLGNGVNQNDSESTVAAGSEYTDNKNFEVYALTHSDLAVDYFFKVDGTSGSLTSDASVNSAAAGSRMSLVTNGCNGTGTAYPRPIFSTRYISDTFIRMERRRAGQNFPAWVQGIDFSGITY